MEEYKIEFPEESLSNVWRNQRKNSSENSKDFRQTILGEISAGKSEEKFEEKSKNAVLEKSMKEFLEKSLKEFEKKKLLKSSWRNLSRNSK